MSQVIQEFDIQGDINVKLDSKISFNNVTEQSLLSCQACKNQKLVSKKRKKVTKIVKVDSSLSSKEWINKHLEFWKNAPLKPILDEESIKKLDNLIINEIENSHSNFPEKRYLNSTAQNRDIVINLLRDESFHIYKYLTKEFQGLETKALELIESTDPPSKCDLNQSYHLLLMQKLKIHFDKHVKFMLKKIRDLPGFERVCSHDIHVILNEQIFILFGLREIGTLIIGEKGRSLVMEFFYNLKMLNLTEQELALLVPFILTISSKNVQDSFLIQELNEYYGRALISELSLNQRSKEFIKFLLQVIAESSKLNQFCFDILINYGIKPLDI
ncbi:unnamed protein product [Brachionus calyciflorus]|uniref:Uncharacterized protein n=1 Tax=Brachionus calyciflorus TaxID=104777 RepID=A0A813R7U0_9BILA|nr:unnamed protein product [Brachionus calyciflorus]